MTLYNYSPQSLWCTIWIHIYLIYYVYKLIFYHTFSNTSVTLRKILSYYLVSNYLIMEVSDTSLNLCLYFDLDTSVYFDYYKR